MESTARHLVIVGPMGVGKTTVGALVAEHLGWSFVDSDRVIEALHGRTGSDIASTDGVGRLHRIEAEVLDEALGFAPPSVIAAAASVADDAVLLDRMSSPGVVVVLLTCAPSELARRTSRGRHRRRVDDGEAARLAQRRRDAIEPTGATVIDVTDIRPLEAATTIVGLVRHTSG